VREGLKFETAIESDCAPLWEPVSALMQAAATLRDRHHGNAISYSRKVFIPLTRLCRDVCHYCTFAHPPKRGERVYLGADEVLAIARTGAAAGCKEALATSRSCATRSRARSWRRLATTRRSRISPPSRGWCSRRPGCCPTLTPAF
jgi:biotin synthase-like enzyme